MFWDKISPLYDLFENVYNGKVYTGTGSSILIPTRNFLKKRATEMSSITLWTGVCLVPLR